MATRSAIKGAVEAQERPLHQGATLPGSTGELSRLEALPFELIVNVFAVIFWVHSK